jgi:hypothetical protein
MPTSNRTTSSPSERRRRARWIGAAAVLVVLGVGGVVAIAAGGGRAAGEPVVRLQQHVPAAVEREVRATVAEFVAVFEDRRECIGGSELRLVRAIDEGDARYVGAEQLIEIEIPTSPRRFRDSLVHELAHHVERTCPDAADLREAIVAATGATAWAGQARWEHRPSELWAEAVVQIVLGERVRFARSVPLDDAVVDAARRWIARPAP